MSNKSVYINDIASFFPNQPIQNDEVESVLGLVGGKPSRSRKIVLRNNGIKTRYYAINPSTGKQNYNNAEITAAAIRKLDIDLKQVDCLVCGTSIPDQLMPNHSAMVQGKLGKSIGSCEVVATSGVCLAGLTALKYGYSSILSGLHEKVVTTGSETVSAYIKSNNFDCESDDLLEQLGKRPEIAFEKDFLRWMLSDAAGAILLEASPRNTSFSTMKIEWIETRSYANIMETCMYAGAEKIEGELIGWTNYTPVDRNKKSVMAIKQDVRLLNDNIIKYTVEEALSDIVSKTKIKANSIDFFVPHYSSHYFRERVKSGLEAIDFDISYDKWFTNLYEKGNTGSASIYTMLDDLRKSGHLKSGNKVLCCVPESGRFSIGCMLLTVL